MGHNIEIWEKIHQNREWGKYPNEELVRFIGSNFFRLDFKNRKNLKILELGCGQGANLWFLCKEGFNVFGMDISNTALKNANKYLKQLNHESILLEGDFTYLPFKDECLDIIIDVASIQHSSFNNHVKIFNEVQRALKKGGFLFTFHIGKDSWGYGQGKLIDKNTFNELSEGPASNIGITCMLDGADLKELLKHIGFIDCKIEKLTRTYDNQNKKLTHYIVSAMRPI